MSRSAYNSYLSQKKKKLNESQTEHDHTGKIAQKKYLSLVFINPYEKCSDFSNYKSFLLLNLKFLRQNHKMKGAAEDENVNLNTMVNQNEMLMKAMNSYLCDGSNNNVNNTNQQ